MIKKTIKYVDYNGTARSEDFYFNLNKAEVAELRGELGINIESSVRKADQNTLVKILKTLILSAYGEKSDDGRRFIKNSEIANDFYQTEAYSELFTELASDETAFESFLNGVLPSDITSQIAEATNAAANN